MYLIIISLSVNSLQANWRTKNCLWQSSETVNSLSSISQTTFESYLYWNHQGGVKRHILGI